MPGWSLEPKTPTLPAFLSSLIFSSHHIPQAMSTPANAASPPKPKSRAKLPGPPYLDLDPPPASQPSPERLAALYAFTRTQRESNPDGYAANVKWWGNVLAGTLAQGYLQSQAPSGKDKVTVSGDVLVLNVTEGMLDKLANGGQRPRGMGGVIVSPD